MKWYWFVLCTVLCWGTYITTLHKGQQAFAEPTKAALRAFVCVGAAYIFVTLAILAYLMTTRDAPGSEPMIFTPRGVMISFAAGILGATGALGIIFALKSGGHPLSVAPLVFAGAPIMNTIFAMLLYGNVSKPDPRFFIGIVLAGVGAAMVLRYKPSPKPHAPATTVAATTAGIPSTPPRNHEG